MTSAQIRKSFLDFFKSKQHTIVPSSSLMPDSPNLLFTNAGMNQFVPIFLGQTKCPYTPGRAADTQKCIRAGGKHNDLEDVGLDTYHHTFFEMLGNWSFGDYFKREAIDWAWELVVTIWKFPPQRLYATVYNPDKTKNDPSEFDQEAWNFWAEKFRSVGLDPAVHIVNGNKKDNFWMMGETGPCGPCSELHVDLTPAGDTKGGLVNKGDARCIEIWNLVFIQFNANPDGTFSPLPAKHVDTGMGFERVTSIIQGTKNFSDFANAKISNYETDIFRPIFDVLEKMSGKTYKSTLPVSQSGANPAEINLPRTSGNLNECSGKVNEPSGNLNRLSGKVAGSSGNLAESSGKANEEAGKANNPAGNLPGSLGEDRIALDIAFRVIADHIRTLSFAIADGIQPGNNDRNYVLRRILRRAVRYGRTLGFHEPFFYKLVDVLADTMGDVFPEIRARKKQVQETIRTEEEAFNKTLDKGIEIFQEIITGQSFWVNRILNLEQGLIKASWPNTKDGIQLVKKNQGWPEYEDVSESILFYPAEFTDAILGLINVDNVEEAKACINKIKSYANQISGFTAFTLYDTYGFPLDLTELMAREHGLIVNLERFEMLMEKQRARARAAQKKEVISLSQIETTAPTKFVGYETVDTKAKVIEIVGIKDKTAIIFDISPLYAEMGGQVGDTGIFYGLKGDYLDDGWKIINTQKSGNTWLHFFETIWEEKTLPEVGSEVAVVVDELRRKAIERHHTVTHLLHWALHEVASKEASQKGSFVGPDKLTFDFNSAPLTPAQVADIEKLVNERILENAGVSWTEVPHADVKHRKDVMQFFGDKYGDTVRVVQIGGHAGKLDGYSMELCGGTHTRATGEIGLFRIVGESAIAAGVRRIEAVAGLTAYDLANEQLQLIRSLADKLNSPVHELEKKIESFLAHQKELEKQLKARDQREAADKAQALYEEWKLQAPNVSLQPIQNQLGGIPMILHKFKDASSEYLQVLADAVKQTGFKGVVVFASATGDNVSLLATVSPEFTAKIQAGKIIQAIAPIVGGKGGGKPDHARGGGKDATKLDEALSKAAELFKG